MPAIKFVATTPGRKVILQIRFKPPQARTQESQLVWRYLKFPSTSRSFIYINLPDEIGFFLPQQDSEDEITASDWEPCGLGQVCKVVDIDTIDEASKGKAGVYSCINATDQPLDIGLGLLEYRDDSPQGGVVLWRDVEPNEMVSTAFEPHVMIYEGDALLWSHEVHSLEDETILRVAVVGEKVTIEEETSS